MMESEILSRLASESAKYISASLIGVVEIVMVFDTGSSLIWQPSSRVSDGVVQVNSNAFSSSTDIAKDSSADSFTVDTSKTSSIGEDAVLLESGEVVSASLSTTVD